MEVTGCKCELDCHLVVIRDTGLVLNLILMISIGPCGLGLLSVSVLVIKLSLIIIPLIRWC